MKFRITFKDPDGVYEDLRGKVNLLKAEQKYFDTEAAMEDLVESISPWVEFQEYITIEFDTEEKTAKVIPI